MLILFLGNSTFISSTGRITLSDSKNVQNAILQIDEAQMLDRGEYSCSAHNIATTQLNATRSAVAFVRVKGSVQFILNLTYFFNLIMLVFSGFWFISTMSRLKKIFTPLV